MNDKDTKYSNYVLEENSSINAAMEAITLNHRGAVLVVNNLNQVVGVVSDGDIRRAMVKGVIMEAPVRSCINYNYIFLLAGSADKGGRKLFAEHLEINLLPVIGENNKLVDLIIRGGAHGFKREG